MNKLSKEQKYALITFAVLLFLIISLIQNSGNGQNRNLTKTLVETEQPITKPESDKEKVIRGLLPGVVYVNFTQRGFNKNGPIKIPDNEVGPDAGKYCWNLSKLNGSCGYDLMIYGPSPAAVDTLIASVTCSEAKEAMIRASDYLPFVASIQYKEADVDQAMSWVTNNLNQLRSDTEIGGVKFRLIKNGPNYISIYIGFSPDDYFPEASPTGQVLGTY